MEKGETFLKITGSNELPQLGNLVTWRTTKSALSNLLKSKVQEVEKVQQNQVFVPGKPEPQYPNPFVVKTSRIFRTR